MKSVDNSVVSRSQSQSNGVSNTNFKNIVTGSYSWTDVVFPLFDEMLKYGQTPAFLEMFVVVYLVFQLTAVAFWPCYSFSSITDSIDDQVKLWILRVGFMTKLSHDVSDLTISIIIFSILLGLIIFTLIVLLILYKQSRRFNRAAIITFKIFFDVIPIITIMPLSCFVGISLKYALLQKNSTLYVFTAVGAIYLIIVSLLHYLNSYFCANSPYISSSLIACWSGAFHFEFVEFSGLFLIFSFVFDFFSTYFSIILIIFKVAVNIYMIYRIHFLPFSHISMNEFFSALYCGLSLLDIFELVSRVLTDRIRTYIFYASYVAVFVVAFIIIGAIYTKRIKKIIHQLSFESLDEDNEEDMNPDEFEDVQAKNQGMASLTDAKRRAHFIKLGLDRSTLTCEMFFRVGLAHNCPLLLDWSVLKFAGEHHRSSHMMSIITQFLTFFPSEPRLLSYFFRTAIANFNLTYPQRFLMYQVNVIRGLRQSSASNEVAENILQLRNKANAVIEDVKKFWIDMPEDENSFYQIYKHTKNVRELYSEALVKWPNNVRICENFSNFLIEGATDFKQGVFIKNRAELTEQGKNFVVDLSFRSLVRAYPAYLKKNILDVHGRFIQEVNARKSGSSATGNSQMSTGTIDGILDPEIEESIAKNLFTYHRLRIEFQQCLANRRLKYFEPAHSFLIFSTVLAFGIAAFFFGFYYDHYDQRLGALTRQIKINTIKHNIECALLSNTFQWFYESGAIPEDTWKKIATPRKSEYEIDLSIGRKDVSRFITEALNNLSSFSTDLMSIAKEGTDVASIMSEIVNPIVNSSYCSGVVAAYNIKPYYKKESLQDIYVRYSNHLLKMSMEDTNGGDKNLYGCEIFATIEMEENALSSLASSVIVTLKSMEKSDKKLNQWLMICIPIAYFLIVEIPVMVLLRLNVKELGSLHRILTDIHQDVRETAARSLSGGESDDSIVKETAVHNKMGMTTIYVVGTLPVLVAVIMIFSPYICEKKNEVFGMLNNWIFYSHSRAYFSMGSVIYAALSVAFSQTPRTIWQSGIELDQAINGAKNYIKNIDTNNDDFLRGGDGMDGSISYSSELDRLNIESYCIEDDYDSNDHKNYNCSSLDANINTMTSFIKLIVTDPAAQTFESDSAIIELFHICNSHIIERVIRSSSTIYSIAEDEITEFRTDLATLFICTLILSVIVTGIVWIYFNRLEYAYSGALQELRRIPPLAISQNQSLMNYITRKKESKKIEAMTPSKSVIYTSQDSVIFINKTENIDFINESVTHLFGYTPDQLLGQNINTILPDEKNHEFYNQLEMMKNGQCALTYEKSFIGYTDDEQAIPVHTTLVGVATQGSKLPNSFVVIMRDESQLIEQRNSAELAKQQSEKLLYQILPRAIVQRLNSGETEITFTVPMATVIFIDIVKFSEYSATLSPSQIMEHLSIIFAKFDNICTKYPLITKIKLIGDVYMAAAGLFNPEEPPQNHASQTVNFALDALQALDEVNAMLNANLKVRIGINTNGPLIAGVLGTDKPVFDIIGDPINVSSRLQSTAVPNTIQISEETFKVICNLNYNIEKRGEIELKGKGKKVAYVVRSAILGSFYQQSSESEDQ